MSLPPHYHFMGIGGVGMSALAQVLLKRGQRVSGCDAASSQAVERLREAGAVTWAGHDPAHLRHDVQVLVYSSAVPDDHPELQAARAAGLRVLHRGALLAELMAAARGIAIAGTHGKTTTTGMIATVLKEANRDPTVLVGGEVPTLGSNARVGEGPWLVAEADESDGSFRVLRPEIAVVTNIDDDHLAHYGSMSGLVAAFAEFVSHVKAEGTVVLCWDDPRVRALPVSGRRLTYGLGGGDVTATHVTPLGFRSRLALRVAGRAEGDLLLQVPGQHNAENALAAVAAGLAAGLAVDEIKPGLEAYRGARRRFEVLHRDADLLVVDDYAHHPTEVRATIAAARGLQPRRLWVVFQPHRFSRTAQLAAAFGPALAQADRVTVTGIYAAGEEPLNHVGGHMVYQAVKELGHRAVEYVEDPNALGKHVLEDLQPGDLIITMGAGNIRQLGEWLARALARSPKESKS